MSEMSVTETRGVKCCKERADRRSDMTYHARVYSLEFLQVFATLCSRNYFEREDTYKYVHAARNIRQVLSQTANMPYLACRLNKIACNDEKLLTLIVHTCNAHARTRINAVLEGYIASLNDAT